MFTMDSLWTQVSVMRKLQLWSIFLQLRVFDNTVPIVTALGLHRKSTQYRNGGRQPADYIISECRKRTFWVLYTIDKYLAVVFGRPRFYHDNDVDQEFPDRVNDEDMTPQGPSPLEPAMDCHVDSLLFHAR